MAPPQFAEPTFLYFPKKSFPFFFLICFCLKWSKKSLATFPFCQRPYLQHYKSKTLTWNVSLLKKQKNKLGMSWIQTALLLILQLPQKCWPLNSRYASKATTRDETFHKRKCQRGDRDFSSGKGKKYEEDRGHAELLEVIISSACLLVSDADERVRLTVLPIAAAGRRDEHLLNCALFELVPKVVYTAADKGGATRLQLKNKTKKNQTWRLKSDTISRVIYSQLAAVPPLPGRLQTDVPLALMKETTNRLQGSTVGGEALYDDVAPLVCLKDNIFTECVIWPAPPLILILAKSESILFVAYQRIGISGLINKNKFLNYFSPLIALPGGANNSMQRVPLTFKTQINFVSWNWGYLSGVTRRCVAYYHPSLPVACRVTQWNFMIVVNVFFSLSVSFCGAFFDTCLGP